MFTQTIPLPPPGIGVPLATTSVLALLEVAVVAAAAGEGLTELFGLKKSARVFLAGEGETTGEAEAAAVAAVFFFRVVFAAGDAAAAGEALLAAAGEALAVASAFLWERCLAGEGEAAGEGDGDWALTMPVTARPTHMRKAKIFMFMDQNLTMRRPDGKAKKRHQRPEWGDGG